MFIEYFFSFFKDRNHISQNFLLLNETFKNKREFDVCRLPSCRQRVKMKYFKNRANLLQITCCHVGTKKRSKQVVLNTFQTIFISFYLKMTIFCHLGLKISLSHFQFDSVCLSSSLCKAYVRRGLENIFQFFSKQKPPNLEFSFNLLLKRYCKSSMLRVVFFRCFCHAERFGEQFLLDKKRPL